MVYEDMSVGYINIALIKYWCKDKFNPYLIPLVPSISLRSNRLYTKTRIQQSDIDEFILNDQKQDEEETKKIFSFIDKIVKNRPSLRIISYNNMPTAAGFASSSSAYCALTKEINKFFKLNLDINMMAKISTMGSGSSARSFYNLCAFDTSQNIYELQTDLDLAMLGIIISSEKKMISSTKAMQITKETSSIITQWINENNHYYNSMIKALKENDFDKVGILMEKSTKLMHETMVKSKPSFTYINEDSKKCLEYIEKLKKSGLNIYYTMDAGPNIKILYQKQDEKKIIFNLEKEYKGKIILC